MANNRMFVKCTKCNKRICIAKYYPSTYWQAKDTATKIMNEFFDDHMLCDDDNLTSKEDCFVIEYE